MKIFLDYDFIDWNSYISAERANKYLANKIKQEEKAIVAFKVKEKYKGSYPVTLTIRPHFKHKRRDLDNYRLKGLIDGLVSAGVIENDNLTKIDKIILEPIFDGSGVEIEIQPTKQEPKVICPSYGVDCDYCPANTERSKNDSIQNKKETVKTI